MRLLILYNRIYLILIKFNSYYLVYKYLKVIRYNGYFNFKV